MDLFDLTEFTSINTKRLPVVPVSVIDIESGTTRTKRHNSHKNKSSRSEYSPFPHEVCNLCYSLFLRDRHAIFDPFAGWGERGAFARQYGKLYTGFDVSDEAISNASEMFGVDNKLNDSLTADIPTFDGLLTCPPYWNLEKYAGRGIDLTPTWDCFVVKYKAIITRCIRAASAGSVFCVMVGNWRKDGVYYDLQAETDAIFRECGLTCIDKVIVSRKKISKIKIMVPQAKRLGYTVNVHEHLLVYKKDIIK